MPRGTRRRTLRKDGPHPVDVLVGHRLRMRRTLLGMSQGNLADALGLTFQQLQKYEKGANRVSASRMFELSQILDVPVSYFFEELPIAKISGARAKEATPVHGFDRMTKRETLELSRAYHRIKSRGVRQRILKLMRSIAQSSDVAA